jgi:hypothetical protein
MFVCFILESRTAMPATEPFPFLKLEALTSKDLYVYNEASQTELIIFVGMVCHLYLPPYVRPSEAGNDLGPLHSSKQFAVAGPRTDRRSDREDMMWREVIRDVFDVLSEPE